MKRILYALLMLMVLNLSGLAKEKLVDRSASKMPAWVGVATEGCIAVSAVAPTMDEAQSKCMMDIRQQIITSVAANITSSENYQALQISHNDLVNVFERYSSETQTVGANLPFITGISIAKAKEIYWEKYYNKTDKSYHYVYHILYPFSNLERNKWIKEFLEQDEAQYNKYIYYKNQIDSFKNVEFIQEAVGELSTLYGYFFDSRRKGEISQLQNRYNKLYEQIAIQPVHESLGAVYYSVAIGNRVVTVDKMPRIKSKSSASDLSVSLSGEEGVYAITYNAENCYPEDDNSIEVAYSIGGKSIKRTFYFDVNEDKMKVTPTGLVNISCMHDKRSNVCGLAFEIHLRSAYDNEFEVKYLILNIPGINKPIKGDVDFAFKGKGNHLMVFNYSCDGIDKDKLTDGVALLDGTFDVLNKKTGDIKAVPFKLPFKVKK